MVLPDAWKSLTICVAIVSIQHRHWPDGQKCYNNIALSHADARQKPSDCSCYVYIYLISSSMIIKIIFCNRCHASLLSLPVWR